MSGPPDFSGHRRLVTRNFIVLGGGELVGRLIGFAAMVYAARALGTEAYGIIGFALAVILYFQSLVDGGLDLLGPRLAAQRPEQIPDLLASIVGSRLLVAALVGLVLAVTAFPLLPSPEDRVLALYGLTLLGFALSTRWLHVGLDRGAPVAASRLLGGALTVGLVLAWVRTPADVGRVPVAYAIAEAIASLVLFGWLLRSGIRPGRVRASLVLPAWRSAGPLLASVLLGLVVYNADFVLLRIFRGRTDVGLYLAAYALISFLGQLGLVARLSLIPTLSRVRDDPEVEADMNATAAARVSLIGLPIAVGGFLVGGDLITSLFGADFAPAGMPLRLLIWTLLLLYWRGVIEAFLIARDQQRYVMRATAAAAVMNVALNLLLIPRYGMTGAAAATVATEAVRLGMIGRFAAATGYRGATFGRLVRPLAATAAMALVVVLFEDGNPWASIGFGIGAFVAAGLAVGLVGRDGSGGWALRV